MSMQDIANKEIEARKYGLHYGVYMSNLSKKKANIKLGRDISENPIRTCQVCNAPLHGKQLKYCSPNCREKHKRANWMGDKYV